MDEVFDFVVVGSGGGSMCAALAMRNAGKSVLILEKTDLIGGTTARAGGVMWIPNNRFMAPAGVEDSFEKASTYLDAVVGDHNDTPGATRERRQTYLREAPAMVDFLVDEGIKLCRNPYWPDYYDDRPGGSKPGRTVSAELFDLNELGDWAKKLRTSYHQVPSPHREALYLPLMKVSWRSKYFLFKAGIRGAVAKLAGKRLVTAGAALQGRMLQAALRKNVEFRTDAPVKELILENGAVVGVVATMDGQDRRLGARLGVLLNAGGFAHNQEMRDKYIPHTSTKWSAAAPGDTGDLHLELMRIGAWMAQMSARVGMQATLPPGAELPALIQMDMSKPHTFVVDQSGERYQNEAGSYSEFSAGQLAHHERSPAIPSWMIMDSQFLRRYMLAGTLPGAIKPQSWLDQGYLQKAETIEALAAACGIDPKRLKATTERFNGFARKNRDEDFHRGDRAYDRWLGDYTHKVSAAMGAVEEAPFYAIPVYPGDVGTYGGVVTDADARVLREDGSVIAGLYATGTTTASVMGHKYPGAGSSIGPSFTWGFVAAKHAAGRDRQTGGPKARRPGAAEPAL